MRFLIPHIFLNKNKYEKNSNKNNIIQVSKK